MKTILIVNPKGGCGKTTIAINLAGYYATKSTTVALVDLDSQRSSTLWAESRSHTLPTIHFYDDLYEFNEQRIVIDCPAKIDLGLTAELINEADTIIIPINPSIIDQRAAFKFIFDIRKLIRGNYCKKTTIGMVPNRSNPSYTSHKDLIEFSRLMKVPIITSLRNSQNYVQASDKGLSIFELPQHKIAVERKQWRPLTYWAEGMLLKKRPESSYAV